MVRNTLSIGPGLLAAADAPPNQLTAMFHRDGRHLLKQLANALGFREPACTITTRPGNATSCGEVVLRARRLLVVLHRDTGTATLSYSAVEPGVSIAPEDVQATPVEQLQTPQAQKVLVERCRELAG